MGAIRSVVSHNKADKVLPVPCKHLQQTPQVSLCDSLCPSPYPVPPVLILLRVAR